MKWRKKSGNGNGNDGNNGGSVKRTRREQRAAKRQFRKMEFRAAY